MMLNLKDFELYWARRKALFEKLSQYVVQKPRKQKWSEPDERHFLKTESICSEITRQYNGMEPDERHFLTHDINIKDSWDSK